MLPITSLTEAEAVLAEYETPTSAVAYSLDTVLQLAEVLGNPQNELSIIHVAGTSGKTSTSYYCASLLKEAGLKVGLSVSPHIDSVMERTQVNLENLDEATYCAYLTEFIGLVKQTGFSPTYFELLVVFSYWVFARKERVDVAVIEVGLGGLLDGTNIISSSDKVCVIADIGLDHMAVLGDTISEIAAQKSGIIQDSNQVFIHKQSSEVMEVVRRRVQEKRADLTVVDIATYPTLPLFQQRNFSLALEVVRAFLQQRKMTLDEEQIKRAMSLTVPARMEAREINGKTVIFDGSHNEQKIAALTESLRDKYPNHSMTFVVAFGANRLDDAGAGLKLVRELSDDIIVTQFESHQDSRQQSLSAGKLADIAREAGFTSVSEQPDPKEALKIALDRSASMVVVTGSFYLLRYVR